MSITLLQYFANKAAEINANAFKEIQTLEDWKREREELYRHFLHSLGLERAHSIGTATFPF